MSVSFTNGITGCCAVTIIAGFWYDEEGRSVKFQAAKKKEQMEAIDSLLSKAITYGLSIAIATVSESQLLSEECLQELGFISTQDDWAYRSRDHSSNTTGVKVYTKILVQ